MFFIEIFVQNRITCYLLFSEYKSSIFSNRITQTTIYERIKYSYGSLFIMLELSRLAFIFPVFIFVPIVFSFIKWTKERKKIALASFPAIYFMYKVLNYQFFEPFQIFTFNLVGFIFSILFVIGYLFYLNRKNKR